MVASIRGAAGGYQLVTPPSQISLGQVMEAIDGVAEPAGLPSGVKSDSPAARGLAQTWQEAADLQRKLLDSVTLADLLERAKQRDEQTYHI